MRKYIVFRTLSGRAVIGVIMLLSLILLILLVLPGSRQKIKEYPESRVKDGVTFMGEDVGGLSEEEVTALVREYYVQIEKEPVDAVIDPVTGGVIPELYGYELDIYSTTKKIIGAFRGETVLPVVDKIIPEKTMKDFPEAPLHQGNPEKKQVSFLVNVAWGDEYIHNLLDVMEENNVRSTFFFVGKWVEKTPELVLEIISRGHEAANHGYRDTVIMSELTLEEIKADITKTNYLLRDITNREVKYFSSHCGEINEDVLRITAELNMRTVMWSLDTVDWMLP
ncbi:MAG: hypothetical protein CVU88_03240, partial [Firmicutes bacterium HGW-Firmicutes-13]